MNYAERDRLCEPLIFAYFRFFDPVPVVGLKQRYQAPAVGPVSPNFARWLLPHREPGSRRFVLAGLADHLSGRRSPFRDRP